MKIGFWGYFFIGLKTAVVLFLSGVIMFIVNSLTIQFSAVPWSMIIIWVVAIIGALTLNGYMLSRFKSWVFG